MIRISFCLLWLILCLASGCNVRQSSSPSAGGEILPSDTIRYAKGYTVERCAGYTKIEVRDPWNEGRLLQRYLLVSREAKMPGDLPQGTIVRVPIKNIVVYTAVHGSMLDVLGVSDDIAGVCESRYMDNIPSIITRLKNGMVVDLGESTAPNIEKMIAIGAEAVLASPFQNGSYGPVEKTGIPIIECADYMETDPLGRAEWIKFLGFFIEKEERADSLFRQTESNYLRIKNLAKNITHRPTLLTGCKYGTPWHVSAGQSYIANIYEDAGADYIFKYLQGTGGTPLSFETVLDKAIHADIWLIYYNQDKNMTYADLRSEYAPYAQFDAFQKRHIFGCNTNSSKYYEEEPMHPDYLLEELIAIFHPELLPEHKFRYFAPLEE